MRSWIYDEFQLHRLSGAFGQLRANPQDDELLFVADPSNRGLMSDDVMTAPATRLVAKSAFPWAALPGSLEFLSER